jgi:DNA polymerase III alpha subunit
LYEERDRNGPYTSLVELINRLKPGAETLALLVQSGACDCFGLPRPVLYLQAESELRRSTQELFAPRIPDRWAPVQVSKLHKAHDEWQTLGFTLEMPLIAMLRASAGYATPVGFGRTTSCDDFSRSIGKKITIEGTVAASRRTTTESGKPMQFISLEDETGLADVVLFPGNCNPIAHLSIGPYVVQGIVEEHHGVAVLAATKISSTQGKQSLHVQEYSGGFS